VTVAVVVVADGVVAAAVVVPAVVLFVFSAFATFVAADLSVLAAFAGAGLSVLASFIDEPFVVFVVFGVDTGFTVFGCVAIAGLVAFDVECGAVAAFGAVVVVWGGFGAVLCPC